MFRYCYFVVRARHIRRGESLKVLFVGAMVGVIVSGESSIFEIEILLDLLISFPV